MSEITIFDHKTISCALKDAFVRIADGNRLVNVRLMNSQDTVSFSSRSRAMFYSNGMSVETSDSMMIIPYSSICFVEVST